MANELAWHIKEVPFRYIMLNTKDDAEETTISVQTKTQVGSLRYGEVNTKSDIVETKAVVETKIKVKVHSGRASSIQRVM